MRSMVLLVSLCLVSTIAASESQLLTFDDIVQRAASDSALLTRAADLARFQGQVASTGRFSREGPTLEAELGPRRMADGARRLEATARIDVQILSGGRARVEAGSRLRNTSPDILAADAVESRLRLRTAYLDAWLWQERLEVIDRQVESNEQLLASVQKRVEGGAEAPYEADLVEGEMLRSRSESDGARAALGEAWSALRALADLPPEPQTLASPGVPDLGVPQDAESRFAAGAWGLGWEVWLNGMEISQFTYFQQVGGLDCCGGRPRIVGRWKQGSWISSTPDAGRGGRLRPPLPRRLTSPS